jgi:hypothetical protein
VFWRDAPLGKPTPHIGVMPGSMVAFLALVRIFTRRRERA